MLTMYRQRQYACGVIEPDPACPGAILVHLKVVPGSSREQIAGALGLRLKIKVAAPPEKGKANEAVMALLAKALGIPPTAISVVKGAASPEKTVQIRGVALADALQRLASSGS
jgi:uncharacterized protein (TIGR00251 family)